MSSGWSASTQQNGHNITGIFVRNTPPLATMYVGTGPKGCLVLDINAGVIYQNTGTIDVPVWTVFGSVLPAVASGAALPTADPQVVGQLWANAGVVTVSAG